MADNKINSVEMYGITRYKSKRSSNSLGWKVSMSRRGKMLNKSFSDLRWGDAENALAAAKRYRDALVQRAPPITMREYAQTVRASNTSGFVGVHSMQSRSGVVSWRASIQLPGGKVVSKTFAESIHGSRARELAIQTRQELLNLVDETSTYTRSPGAIAKTNPTELPAVPLYLPHTIIVRVWRPGINGGVAKKSIHIGVSGAINPRVEKTFGTGVHGQAGAFRLAMQTALEVITQFGGEEAAQIFMRDYVEKYKRLPKKGISARIRLVAVEDSKKPDISEEHCDNGDADECHLLTRRSPDCAPGSTFISDN